MKNNFEFDVIIIGGFGHVGLPMGIVLANAGLQVALYDIDKGKRADIEAGRMPFIEYDAEPMLKRVIGKTLHVADNLSDVSRAKTIIVTIGTPIDEYLNPKIRPILGLAQQMVDYVGEEQCLILRSTVYPGTSQRLKEFFSHKDNKVHIAYCPERIVQGYAVRELSELPQIISGFSSEAIQMAKELFGHLGVETIEVMPVEAELSKLFSNAWRYIQF